MKSQTAPTRRAGQPRPRPNLKLLEARMRAGMSREDVGRLAGISEKQVGLIERGVARHPRMKTVAGIAEAVHADVLDLFPIGRA